MTSCGKLAEMLDSIEVQLETLERRGIELRMQSVNHVTPDGLLPRYRVFLGAAQHWFSTKPELDAFLAEAEKKAGGELRVADEPLDQLAAGESTETKVPSLQVNDLHEIRTINDALKRLHAEFGLTLNDLLVSPPVNGEPVHPYQLDHEVTPRKLMSIRELVSSIRTIGERGLIYTRFKGLGEMNPDELYETAMDPSNRILKRVALEDAAAAEEIFRVLMGEQVEPRREFIEKHALEVTNLDV